MESMDFMAMRRKVMAEDQVLAGQRQAEAQARARAVANWLNLLCEEEVPESLRRKVAARGVRLV
ncbi:hypothetical protein MGLY_19880 [Neomoorella glycerini]|uniref:Uncharacterized protein n=1 Tax=Neomoorella glycerini TaxID=55779 RepID=A0A6I5ZRI0_9FIRM|nr:hypothetical protein [Moorella glycerini]QGP92602.1 hypothetical protein MGLY_19880 [Moorella glycerini]